MGSGISTVQMAEYRELVKDRLSPEAISFLFTKFKRAAPDGVMTPALFAKYIESTGVYKDRKLRQQRSAAEASSRGASPSSEAAVKGGDAAVVADGNEEDPEINPYPHLFRSYDIDRDGVVTFQEFLLYHLAIIYSTDELFYVVFNAYDEDGDGSLSFGDIKAVITAATRYVGDCDVNDAEVRRVIDEETRRLMGFLDIRKHGRVQREDMRLITRKYPQVLEKMKNLM